MGTFEYQSGNTKFKGEFNIYQAKSGLIMLVMGSRYTALTLSQIQDLNINCYGLENFDHDKFVSIYKIKINKQ